MSFVWPPQRLRVTVLPALTLLTTQTVLAACGSDDDASSSGSGSGAPSEASSEASRGAFPVSVEHKFGTTEIPAPPERVVTVGLSDHDAVLALGVTPVAVTYWYGDYASATWPWAEDELGNAEMTILNDGEFTGEAIYNYEQIAGQRPDLIIGLYTDMSEEQYNTLSDIAPTVAASGDYPDYGMPWQRSTRMVGQALGMDQAAEDLVADVEAQFAAAAEAYPEFDGKQAIVAEDFEDGMSFARGPNDPRTKFMESLGFTLPKRIADLSGAKDGADISDEQMELLDADLLVWNIGFDPELRADIEAKPLYEKLDAVREGRVVFIEDELVSGALTWSTVLSLPHAIDQLTPELAEAVDGSAS